MMFERSHRKVGFGLESIIKATLVDTCPVADFIHAD
jgi:hypothetical protein